VFPTSIITVFMSLYLTGVAVEAAKSDTARNGPIPCPGEDALRSCDISVFGLVFPAGSLWGYLLSVATLVLVPVLPVAGAVADRAHDKRGPLAGTAFTGAAATVAMTLVGGDDWQLGAVIYYSMLPEVAEADERDRVSAWGWAFGYLGSGTLLAAQLAVFLAHQELGLSQGAAVRWCFVMTGLWWCGFTVIPLRRLRRLPVRTVVRTGGEGLLGGPRELRTTVLGARAFPLTLAFLGAYLVYTDGITTVTQVASQYGSSELHLDQEVLIATILIVQFVAFFGGLAHGWLARRLGARRTIVGSLAVWIVVIVSVYFLPAGRPAAFYAVAIGIGLVLGGTNALSRSLFSQMIPAGREAQYFSLYELGERSTSWLGPLVFAGVGQLTGSFRPAIIALSAFFVVGIVLVSLVPVRRAIEAAGNPVPARL
jgi:UMF1 family MFS transporter